MPTPTGALAALVLAGVLLLSAVAKWRQPDSTLSAIRLLRLPHLLQRPAVARALPVAEGVLVALMLAPWPTVARPASWLALLLFIVYLAIIARAMTFDPRPSCGCFGAIGDQRVRAKTVWRNALFVALAVVFVWFTSKGATVPGALVTLGPTGWAWLTLAAATGAVVALVGPGAAGAPSHAHPTGQDVAASGLAAPEDPEEYVRAPIPPAVLIDPAGTPHTVAELAREKPQLLVFANCYCGPTVAALRSAQTWAQRLPQVDVRPVFSGVAVMPSQPDLDTTGAFRDHGSVAWQAFRLHHSPAAVLIGADGLLAGGPVSGNDALEEFFEEIEEALSGQPLPVSSQASSLESSTSLSSSDEASRVDA